MYFLLLDDLKISLDYILPARALTQATATETHKREMEREKNIKRRQPYLSTKCD